MSLVLSSESLYALPIVTVAPALLKISIGVTVSISSDPSATQTNTFLFYYCLEAKPIALVYNKVDLFCFLNTEQSLYILNLI